MPITNVTRSIDLNNNQWYLPHPAGRGINAGYYLIYSASSATNLITDGVGLVKGYKWNVPLSASRVDGFHALAGTIQIVSESLSGSSNWVRYHGSNITHIGAGVNDLTGTLEDDAFFFAHLGQYGTTTATDDAFFYWDRLYLGTGSSAWEYYQYHAHNPTSYPPFNNGRLAMAAEDRNGLVGSEEYAHMINVTVKSGATNYLSVLARIHTPSVGGAHNSHNDLELPAVTNKNYMMGGIINGTSDRFHAFYLTANGTQWDVFSRTFNYSTGVFNAEVDHGTYDLADPQLARTPGSSSLYPFRASAGKLFNNSMYMPVLYNGASSDFDIRIWNFDSANNLQEIPIVTTLITGSSIRPDCHLAVANNVLYAAISDIRDGGVSLYKLSGSTWVDEGQIVTNNNGKYLRVHGLDFNASEFKFYTMISGDTSGSATTYSGSGVYSFTPDIQFLGYTHLDYISGSNSFVVRDALEQGYVQLNGATGTFIRSGSTEPRGIDITSPVLLYENGNTVFTEKRQVVWPASEQFTQGIELQDGRQLFVGTKTELDTDFDISYTNGIIGIFSPGNTTADELYEIQGRFDDTITSVLQSSGSGLVYIAGFTKDLLVNRRDYFIHGIGRGLIKSMTTTEKIEFVDMVLDTTGAQYLAGNHIESSSIIVAKYDANFDLQWQKDISGGLLADTAYGITRDSSGYLYIAGKTTNGIISGSGTSDSFVMKLDATGSILWNKIIGSSGYAVTASVLAPLTVPSSASFDNEYISSIAVITSGSTQRLLVPVVYTGPASGSSTTFVVLDTDGNIVTQAKHNNLLVNRVRQHETTTDGKFTFAGKQYISDNVVYTVTNSGINNYIFNGGGFVDAVDPTLTLYRNNTYTFNVSASGHPFHIKTALSTGTGSLYSGSQGNDIHRSGSYVLNQGVRLSSDTGSLVFFVGEDTPNTIYYACGLHSGMQGTINILDNTTASFGVGNISQSPLINWMGAHQSGSANVEAFDIRNTGTGSLFEYMVAGNEGTNGFVMKFLSSSTGLTRSWTTTTSGSYWKALANTPASFTSASRNTFVVGQASNSGNINQSGSKAIVAGFDHTGSMWFINALGHTGNESFNAIEQDYTGFNYIGAGKSTSHTNGQRGLTFRFSRAGFGTGNYHLLDTAGMAMWYTSASLLVPTSSVGLFTTTTTPISSSGILLTSSSLTLTSTTASYESEIYEGSSVYDGFFGILNLNTLQNFKNSPEYVPNSINRINELFTFFQIGTAGDGEADDGNIFAYDLAELSDGRIAIAAQTSGDIIAYNTGTTGVYDYLIAFFDPTFPTGSLNSFVLAQRGTSFDEELYALTELSDNRVAFCGRTAGNLGGEPVGGYDIFLGIIDPTTLVTDYYTTGSGLGDRALNVHDIHSIIPNTLALIYETSGDVGGNSNLGAQDIGIILFNYSTDTWGTVYQIGTTQNESLNTFGKPSAFLNDGRIAVVGSTTGVFADDGNTFGSSDIFLGIFDINAGTWKKYQIGTGAADFAASVTAAAGNKLLIAGSTAASFPSPNDAITVSFDAALGLKGKIT